MESLVKADIFFFISSIATIVFLILICILLFYLIRTAKNFSELSESLKGDVKESEEFISDIKERLENNLFFRMIFPPLRRKRTIPKTHDK